MYKGDNLPLKNVLLPWSKVGEGQKSSHTPNTWTAHRHVEEETNQVIRLVGNGNKFNKYINKVTRYISPVYYTTQSNADFRLRR